MFCFSSSYLLTLDKKIMHILVISLNFFLIFRFMTALLFILFFKIPIVAAVRNYYI